MAATSMRHSEVNRPPRLQQNAGSRFKAATLSQLRPALPHLDRNAAVRLLKRLRDDGWVEVVGDRRNATWRATKKLRAGTLSSSVRRAELITDCAHAADG